jgi:endonuclease/exonuclease/phosphatase family metal-dependent hydrolase
MRAVGWLLVVALAAGVAREAAATERAAALRVASFNLFHGGPWSAWGDDVDLDRRLGMVARALRGLDVDIVGLQEASEGRDRGNVAARLAHALGHDHVFASATSRILPLRVADAAIRLVHGFREGPAILSRFPIQRSVFYDLPRCAGIFNARILLEADVETPRGLLRVFSTHTAPDACQTRRVAAIVRARRGALPSIVFGDFNAAPSSAAIAVLREAGEFVDAFATANPGTPGATVWQRPGAPAATVTRRVDYVFLVPGTAFAARVVESRVVLDTPEVVHDQRTLWPSDHYGVFAAVEVVPASGARPARSLHAPGRGEPRSAITGDTMDRGDPPMARPDPPEDR